MGELVRGKLIVAPTAKTTTGTGTAVQVAAVTVGQRLKATLHVIAGGGGTLTVVLQSDSVEGMGTPTTRITFDPMTGVGSQTKEISTEVIDTWYRESRTITAGSFTYVVTIGVAGEVGEASAPLGAEGMKAHAAGASYLSYQGAAGEAPYQNVVDLVLESLPVSAEFTLNDKAFASRQLQAVRDNFATDILANLHPTHPNGILLDGAAGLNEFISQGATAAQILAIYAGIYSDLQAHLTANPGVIAKIVMHSQWPFPDVAWIPVMDAINAELRSAPSAYCDSFVDLIDFVPTIEDEEADHRPSDNRYFQAAGNGNHAYSTLARVMADRMMDALKDLFPGLPVVYPDSYRVASADTGFPTTVRAPDGRISALHTLVATLGGVDLSSHPTTPRTYRVCVDDPQGDFDFDGTDDVYDTPGAEDHAVLLNKIATGKPIPNVFCAMPLTGSALVPMVVFGTNNGTNLSDIRLAGSSVPYPWIQVIGHLFRVDAGNDGGTHAEKDDKLRLWEGHLGLTRNVNDFTSWRDAWGRVLDFTILAGAPTVSDDTVGGRTVKTIVLGAADEIYFDYNSFAPIGTNVDVAVKAFVNFADGAGGELAIEGSGALFVKLIGGVTNIRGESTGRSVIDLSPATPRVGVGGNSWRNASMSWNGGGSGWYGTSMGIEGQGSTGVGPIQDLGLATTETARLRIKGPIRIRLIVLTRFVPTADVDQGTIRFVRGLIEFGPERYGTTMDA